MSIRAVPRGTAVVQRKARVRLHTVSKPSPHGLHLAAAYMSSSQNKHVQLRAPFRGGITMRRSVVAGAVLAAGTALAISTATAVPAAAATSGSETVSGTIVTSGVSGTRTVISSVLVAKGVFNGVGRIVEVPSQ